MKVIRVVSELDFGGVEKVLATTLPEFIKFGDMNLKLLVLGKGGMVSEELKLRGISIEIWNLNPKIPNLIILWKLIRYLKKESPSVIHCQGAEANFHGILAGFISKVPNRIGEEIGMPNHHTYWKFIFRFIYSLSHKVIVVAKNVGERIVELKEIKPKKIELLYNPVAVPVNGDLFDSPSYFFPIKSQTNNSNNNPFIFVSICRLVKIKNLERLLESFSQVIFNNSERRINLWIVGDGPEKEKLRQITQSLRIEEYVKFWGFQNDIFKFLKTADVFILPSLSEGSPVSLAEAMLIGLPSIVTKVGGAPEILGNSESGILINPFDIFNISEAMENILKLSNEERIEMGLRAKKEAERFSMESYLSKLFQIYNFPHS